ncbi:MAG TPA: RIP homotypic interaction motif-containing protein [Pseudonocardiaceae bacterium]|nr:RIP homotypic interaction motif-containing protein [Pseudonocardiaceae bacterium]
MSEEAQDDEHDEDFTESGLALAPWMELTNLRPTPDSPVVPARWRGRQVFAVHPEVIEEWAATVEATVVTATPTRTDDEVAVAVQSVDVPGTCADMGLVSPTVPTHAVVIEDSRGVQLGSFNKQENTFEFTVRDVRLVLDEEFLGYDATSGRFTPASSESPAPPPGDFQMKVVVRRSEAVQIGDHNRQRNLFRYKLTGPSLSPAEICTERQFNKIVDKIREGRIGSATADLTRQVRDTFEQSPDIMHPTRSLGVSEPEPPSLVQDVDGGQFGLGNKAINVTHAKIRDIDLGPLLASIDTFNERDDEPVPEPEIDEPVDEPEIKDPVDEPEIEKPVIRPRWWHQPAPPPEDPEPFRGPDISPF